MVNLHFFDSLQRSVDKFGFLNGILDISVGFNENNETQDMGIRQLRSSHHPRVESENHNNLCRNLMVGKI